MWVGILWGGDLPGSGHPTSTAPQAAPSGAAPPAPPASQLCLAAARPKSSAQVTYK